jgi:hypothetical protein
VYSETWVATQVSEYTTLARGYQLN